MFEHRVESRKKPPRRTITLFAVALAALVPCACGGRYLRAEPLPIALRALPESSVTRNVVVVSIDGLRPDAIARYRPPTLGRLLREGMIIG